MCCKFVHKGEGVGELNRALAEALQPARIKEVTKKGAAATQVSCVSIGMCVLSGRGCGCGHGCGCGRACMRVLCVLM